MGNDEKRDSLSVRVKPSTLTVLRAAAKIHRTTVSRYVGSILDDAAEKGSLK